MKCLFLLLTSIFFSNNFFAQKPISMQTNNIVYADLSTYTPKETMTFYSNVFGWKFNNNYGNYIAHLGSQPIIGLYETPKKFQEMKMPHFWMTYIQVESTDLIVVKARELGAIIEMEQTIPNYGKVALIRDPQGAGFTVYEGKSLPHTRTENQANTLIWNELHVSDIRKIIPFYEGIFNWKFQQQEDNHYKIINQKNEHISDVLVIPNEYKGKYEYWAVTFGVEDLQAVKQKVLTNGGAQIVDEGDRILMTDNSNSAFFYIKEIEQ